MPSEAGSSFCVLLGCAILGASSSVSAVLMEEAAR